VQKVGKKTFIFYYVAVNIKPLEKKRRYRLVRAVMHNLAELPITDEAQMCPGRY